MSTFRISSLFLYHRLFHSRHSSSIISSSVIFSSFRHLATSSSRSPPKKQELKKSTVQPPTKGEPLELTAFKPSKDFGDDYLLPHPLWSSEYVNSVEVTHERPQKLVDHLAYWSVKLLRFNFDWMTGFIFGKRTPKKWLTRVCFLESVASQPGWVGATLRHLASTRRLQRDHGWIHTLLEEAENERMHLLIALQLREPGPVFRVMVWLSQGVFFNFFFMSYLLSPRYCHRFVGYLEEEAVKTYTKCLQDIDSGVIKEWATAKAPDIARHYWKLPEDATVRDMILQYRADEGNHRKVNHAFANLKADEINPFRAGH